MDESQRPLLTMCKSRAIDDAPGDISQHSLGLLQTLSSLCSFHNASDLASFLFSEQFNSLVGAGDPWVVFELGIFRDHKKTIELIAVAGNVTLADSQSTGAFENNIAVCTTLEEMERNIMLWHDAVYDEGGRFQ
ncbi:MAG: hypothetical protein P8Q55_03605 [Candidatus Poseidoniaceae archaeon]|nr:hypothetical protein [Candidatus Poseidoniaceae archaeon]